jgi:molybdenum cofactor cytidylyltransferase
MRMAGVNKLLAPVDGAPLVTWTVRSVVRSRARPVIVVVGYERERLINALADQPVDFVDNPDYAAGISSSLRRGVAALPSDIDGVLVCLGDMPHVAVSDIDRLIAAFDPSVGREICVPTFDGQRGNPVLWGKRFIPEIAALSGDVGARQLFAQHSDRLYMVEAHDRGVLFDVDTNTELARLNTQSPLP